MTVLELIAELSTIEDKEKVIDDKDYIVIHIVDGKVEFI